MSELEKKEKTSHVPSHHTPTAREDSVSVRDLELTPFPWTIYDDADPLKIRIKGQYPATGGAHVATVLGRANAQAICALSELVKVLEEIIALKPANMKSNMAHVQLERAKNIANAALAKAKESAR